ncbi:MAG: T9SS type A sorting domain-containing protein [Ignavibacteria bacterium]|nr:T9SS type A sorting domain-containing protein [Ignavibacteria bacterium]
MKKTLLFIFLLSAVFGLKAQYKLSEDFSSGTFPPTGWNRGPGLDDSGNPVWTRSSQSGYASGTGSAFCYFYNWTAGTDSLISPSFTATSSTDTLYFDHAYRTYQTEVDNLNVFTSTDNGASWTLLQNLSGGTTVGTGMVTAAASSANFTAPTAGQWLTKKYVLTAGINRIKFEVITAYGNNLFLDNIKVGQPPSIDVAVQSLGLTGISFATGAGSVAPSGTVINNGGSDATFTVTRKISPGGYSSTKTVTALAPNATQVVTFDNWDYSTGITYTIKDSVYLAGDVNPANDVLSGTLTYNLPKNILIFNVHQQSVDSMTAHLNLAGLSGQYDVITSYPGISLGNWRTIMIGFQSGGGWAAALRDSLKAYLDGSSLPNVRSLLIFGNDLGYNYDPRRNVSAAAGDTVFYRQYLHAQYWSDAWTTNFPASDSTLMGIVSPFTSITGQRVRDQFPDNVAPATWNTGSGVLTSALIPVTESGNGDSCGAIAYAGNYNVFYGTNVYSNYVPTVSGVLSPQGVIFNIVRTYLENNNGQLPVELASFTASVDSRKVTLNWSTASEENNAGFEIERKLASATVWTNAGHVSGAGTSNTVKNYTFTDNNLATGKYNYRLKQVDFNGNYKYYNLSNEINIGVPNKFALSQNYPNPFNPATRINYDLPFDSKVSIKIFDITGKEVSSLVNTVQPAGYYTISFNASALSSGVYFYQINAEGSQSFTKTMKMMLVK